MRSGREGGRKKWEEEGEGDGWELQHEPKKCIILLLCCCWEKKSSLVKKLSFLAVVTFQNFSPFVLQKKLLSQSPICAEQNLFLLIFLFHLAITIQMNEPPFSEFFLNQKGVRLSPSSPPKKILPSPLGTQPNIAIVLQFNLAGSFSPSDGKKKLMLPFFSFIGGPFLSLEGDYPSIL